MNFIRLLTYLPNLRFALIPLGLMLMLSFGKVLYTFLMLLLSPAVFDRLFMTFDTVLLCKIVLLQLILLGSALILDIGYETLAGHLHNKLSMRLKLRLQARAFRFPYEFFLKTNSGDMSKLIIRDTDMVSIGLRDLILTCTNALQVLLISFILYKTHIWFFKIYVCVTSILIIWNILWKPFYYKAVKEYGDINTRTYGFLWGTLGSFREIKILGLENNRLAQYEKIQNRSKHRLWRHDIFNFWMSFINGPVGSLTFAFVLYISLMKIQAGEFSLGMMASFTSIVYVALNPAVQMVMCASNVQIGMAGAALLKDLAGRKKEPDGKTKWRSLQSAVEFKNVNFSYNPDRQILKNVSISIPQGSHIGIVGKTGCGKSTLLSLILKIYQNYDGEITVDGTELRKMNNESLRDAVSYLGQDSICFMGTIRENIDVHKRLTDNEVLEICADVQLGEFVDKLPGGIYTEISDGMMSGGERQRLFLARSIAKGGDLLLFDEATSALDAATEHLILATLKKVRTGKTAVTVAHRVSNVKECDKIYVMHDGEVVEEGTYDELLSRDGRFREIFMETSASESES